MITTKNNKKHTPTTCHTIRKRSGNGVFKSLTEIAIDIDRYYKVANLQVLLNPKYSV